MKSIKLKLNNFITTINQTNQLSPVMELQALLSETYQIDSQSQARMVISAKERKTIDLTTGENEITLSNSFVKLDKPEKCVIVKNENDKTRYTISRLDPKNKKIYIEVPEVQSKVNLTIWYLPIDGTFQMVYEPTGGQSTVRKVFYQGSLSEVNQKDQFKEKGIMLPNRIIFPDWKLKVYIETQAQIDLSSPLAYLEIPVIYYQVEEFTKMLLEQGYTQEQVKAMQLLKD